MYCPFWVFPYHRSFEQWYTLLVVLTHTIPGPPPGAWAEVARVAARVAAVGAAAGVAGAAAGAAVAEDPAAGAAPPAAGTPVVDLIPDFSLSTPPCRLHVPRPWAVVVVPSLHVMAPGFAAWALLTEGAADIATSTSAPHISEVNLRSFMGTPDEPAGPSGRKDTVNPPSRGTRAGGPGGRSNLSVNTMVTRMLRLWLVPLCGALCLTPPVPAAAPARSSARGEWLDRTEAIMGTRVYVQLWSQNRERGYAAIDSVMAEMRRIDALMSHYKPESQLSQINAHANQEPVQVDKELFDLIKLSTHYSEITEGAFDITYASVGYLYDFPRHIHPTEEQIRRALPAVNWRNMLLDERHHTVRFEHPGMRIDLGGIGKGYAVDRGVAILKGLGIEHAVVTAGGDSRIIGDHLGRPWLVAIRHPDDPHKVVTRIPLSNIAMSTSGDYERYFDENGVRYHHIIDPRTGQSARMVRSATILAPTATQTDGMSKTAFVLGPEKTLEIINRMPEYDAVFICPDGRVLYSNGLRPPAPRPAGAPAAASPTAASPRVRP
jgi:thiamine biosynthesis lipoprotein